MYLCSRATISESQKYLNTVGDPSRVLAHAHDLQTSAKNQYSPIGDGGAQTSNTAESEGKPASVVIEEETHLARAFFRKGPAEIWECAWVPHWHVPVEKSLGFRDENSYYADSGKLFNPGEDTFRENPIHLLWMALYITQQARLSDMMKAGQLGSKASGSFKESYGLLATLASTKEQYRPTWNSEDENVMLVRDDLPAGTVAKDYVRRPGRYSQREQMETLKRHLSEFFFY